MIKKLRRIEMNRNVWSIFIVFTVISFGMAYNGYSIKMLWAQQEEQTIAEREDAFQRMMPEGGRKLEILTKGDHIMFFTDTAMDIGTDLAEGTEDDDTVGPFFLVKGDIVEVNGEPAEGVYICRGVILTDLGSNGPPFPFGATQVSQTFIVNGRGVLYCEGIEFLDPGFPPCRVVGGAGEFANVRGVYLQEGGPFPLFDGNIKFTFFLQGKKVRK